MKIVSYEGLAPLPTGVTHNITIPYAEYEWLMETLSELDQHQRWGNEAECDTLREAIRRREWWPSNHQPGDHMNVRIERRIQLAPLWSKPV